MTAGPEPEREYDDELGIVRPPHEPPHDRFFEEGEKPPARYDLEDELEYVLPTDYEVNSREWFRIGAEHWRKCKNDFLKYSVAYFFITLAGGFVGGMIYAIVFDPPLKAGFTVYALGQLTGRRKQYGEFFSGFRYIGRLIVCELPIIGITFVCAIVTEAGFIVTMVTKQYWLVGSLTAFGAVVLISVGTYFGFRLTAFAFELVCDRKFDAIQAMRGSWHLTGRHFWGLFWLMFRLRFLEFIVSTFTCGIGKIWLEPYISLVWTAAYIDIAGSYPIVEEELEGEVASGSSSDSAPSP
ncbi:MAG TPA: hypothetical protein VGZ47_21100 [Gemmataceae bacterium]|jgi:hypothetical protein|nr:hypothetical protein [Gemmataceae bacterium]